MDLSAIQFLPSEEVATQLAVIVPSVVGITQAVKVAGLPSRFLPLFAILLGGVLCYGAFGQDLINILYGIGEGIIATGLVNYHKGISQPKVENNYSENIINHTEV